MVKAQVIGFMPMNWLRWQQGRQVTGYFKMLLFGSRFLDIYPKDVGLPEHTDLVPGYKHFRFNIVLREPHKGGKFSCATAFINTKRIKFFRSDRPHSMTNIDKGRRVVLTFGWVTREHA